MCTCEIISVQHQSLHLRPLRAFPTLFRGKHHRSTASCIYLQIFYWANGVLEDTAWMVKSFSCLRAGAWWVRAKVVGSDWVWVELWGRRGGRSISEQLAGSWVGGLNGELQKGTGHHSGQRPEVQWKVDVMFSRWDWHGRWTAGGMMLVLCAFLLQTLLQPAATPLFFFFLRHTFKKKNIHFWLC